jgi:hypothetical protein
MKAPAALLVYCISLAVHGGVAALAEEEHAAAVAALDRIENADEAIEAQLATVEAAMGASGRGEQELRALIAKAVAAADYDTAAEIKEELEKLHLAKQAPAVAGAAPGGGISAIMKEDNGTALAGCSILEDAGGSAKVFKDGTGVYVWAAGSAGLGEGDLGTKAATQVSQDGMADCGLDRVGNRLSYYFSNLNVASRLHMTFVVLPAGDVHSCRTDFLRKLNFPERIPSPQPDRIIRECKNLRCRLSTPHPPWIGVEDGEQCRCHTLVGCGAPRYDYNAWGQLPSATRSLMAHSFRMLAKTQLKSSPPVDEVAIHFRCGDILAICGKGLCNAQVVMGLLTFSVYKNIPASAKSIGIVTHLSSHQGAWRHKNGAGPDTVST